MPEVTPDSGGVTEEKVMEALKEVDDPEIGMSIVDLGMVRNLHVDGGTVAFELALTIPDCPLTPYMLKNAKEAVAALPGVTDVQVTTRGMTDKEREEAFSKLRGG